jgi:glycosyltransferase involved in cell wall biosynthesis
MTKKPLVSIILPTYNRSSLIKECIDHVLNQTYTNWELIISDDKSTDDTVIVLEKYARLDSRIKINKNNINQGLPHNRNIALSNANGDLIFFIEDDLILFPNCLEVLVDTYNSLHLDNIKVGAIVPRLIEEATSHRENRFKKNKLEEKKIPFVLDKWTGEIYNNYTKDFGKLQETFTGHACCLYNADSIKSIKGYEENVYKGTYSREETDLNFRLIKKGYRFYFQPRAIADHKRINTGGCRKSKRLTQNYYYIRNHIIFIIRIFGLKAVYMIPCFLFKCSARLLRVFYKNRRMYID